MSNEICDYDYPCPHCGTLNGVSSSNQAPNVGDFEECISCYKWVKIIYAKVVYKTEKIYKKKNNE